MAEVCARRPRRANLCRRTMATTMTDPIPHAPKSSADVPGNDVVAVVHAAVAADLVDAQRVGVAFSGGVDSTALLHASAAVKGLDNVVAIIGISPSLAADELDDARLVAKEIGVRLIELPTHEIDNDAYRANDIDRCYHCKAELFDRIDADLIDDLELDAIAYGEIADDATRTDRPGARAATEHGVHRPLSVGGIDKLTVREYLHAVGLPNWDKPASPCLASRIPHHQAVTPGKLAQIDAAESALRHLGFAELRVRHHGDIARIEVPADQLVTVVSDAHRENVVRAVIEAGFVHATIDLAGMRSGFFARIAGS